MQIETLKDLYPPEFYSILVNMTNGQHVSIATINSIIMWYNKGRVDDKLSLIDTPPGVEYVANTNYLINSFIEKNIHVTSEFLKEFNGYLPLRWTAYHECDELEKIVMNKRAKLIIEEVYANDQELYISCHDNHSYYIRIQPWECEITIRQITPTGSVTILDKSGNGDRLYDYEGTICHIADALARYYKDNCKDDDDDDDKLPPMEVTFCIYRILGYYLKFRPCVLPAMLKGRSHEVDIYASDYAEKFDNFPVVQSY